MAWSVRNLAMQFGAPKAFLGPAAYLFANQSTRHVIYLGADDGGNSTGMLYEGYCGTDDVWHFQNLTNNAAGSPPLASGAATAFAFETEGTQHVLYQAGDNHIHELYWNGSWNHNDLTENAGAPEIDDVGQAFGWEFKFTSRQQVAYQGVDRLVHLLSRGVGDNASWLPQTLTTAGDPPCAVGPAGYAYETGASQYITYLSDDKRLYEIVQDGVSGNWGSPVDMGQGLTGVPNVLGDQHRGFADEGSGIRYVDFVGDDYNIYEYSFAGNWKLTNLTQSCAPPAPLAYAGYRPAPYMFPPTQAVPIATQHSMYVAANQIQELWRYAGQTWNENALPGVFEDMLLNSPSAFVDTAANTQNVFFASSAGEIIELRWEAGDIFIFNPPGRQKHARRR
jgi:hypothetical protein